MTKVALLEVIIGCLALRTKRLQPLLRRYLVQTFAICSQIFGLLFSVRFSQRIIENEEEINEEVSNLSRRSLRLGH